MLFIFSKIVFLSITQKFVELALVNPFRTQEPSSEPRWYSVKKSKTFRFALLQDKNTYKNTITIYYTILILYPQLFVSNITPACQANEWSHFTKH